MFFLALKLVLLAVAKCETRVQQQEEALHEVLNIVKQQSKKSAVAAAPDTSVLDEYLPFKSYDDLTAFEEKLTADSDLKLALVSC